MSVRERETSDMLYKPDTPSACYSILSTKHFGHFSFPRTFSYFTQGQEVGKRERDKHGCQQLPEDTLSRYGEQETIALLFQPEKVRTIYILK